MLSEVKVEQIIAIVTTRRISCFSSDWSQALEQTKKKKKYFFSFLSKPILSSFCRWLACTVVCKFTWWYTISSRIATRWHTLRKIYKFHLISWCENFGVRYSFCGVSDKSPKTLWKMSFSTKFPLQEIKWNFGILRNNNCIRRKVPQ